MSQIQKEKWNSRVGVIFAVSGSAVGLGYVPCLNEDLNEVLDANYKIEIAGKHFEARGVHAECIKLNGAMELAPSMGLCKRIVDLVESGSTLKANGLVEIEEICQVSTRLAVNRSYLKTNSHTIQPWIDKIEEVINDSV